VTVSCSSPGVADVSVAMSGGTPEDAVEAVHAAGFEIVSAVNATSGRRLTRRAPRAWITARRIDG
jgi:hypothetical protein